MIPFSVLDLSPIPQGATAAVALHNSLDLAQHAEAWGYRRFWLAEHHNMAGIASAATSVVIGHVAGGTKTIRVGAGGIMLPNHSPLVIAEQFGTLASLYPDRIDLGLGRAPGTDQPTTRALRRTSVPLRKASLTTSKNCSPISSRLHRINGFMPFRDPDFVSPFGYSDQVSLARSLLPNSACPSHLPRISRPRT